MKPSQETMPEEEKRVKKPQEPEAITALRKELEEVSKVEDKVKCLLDFMRTALDQKPQSQLGLFWKARLLCMPLFKENMTQPVRSSLWTRYLELMQEARQIKDVLEEQSAFAIEQIELAIKALEENLTSLDTLLAKSHDVDLPLFKDRALEKNNVIYKKGQKELNLLNSFASRVHSLRKEVIQTGMRLRFKNSFFERLSKCGDQIFPRRKELIKTLSTAFVEDVVNFVEVYFKNKTKEAPNYILRDEIKVFQERAKILTLNTAAFSKSRMELSGAWDELKESDKERKAEFAKKREVFDENTKQVREKIAPFAEACALPGATLADVESAEKEILTFMREIELGREEVRALKEEILKAKQPILEKVRAERQERERQRSEEKAKEQENKDRFLEELKGVVEKSGSYSSGDLKSLCERLMEEGEELALTSACAPLFKQLAEACLQKREEEVFQNVGNSDALNELLDERLEQRQQCKDKIEEMRKAIGGSGLDFESSMQLNDQLKEERERLDTIDEAIDKIEEHMAKLSQ